MQRILIVGCPGSGKSTLGRIISERLSLPLIHLDKLFWRRGWVQAPQKDFDDALFEALKGEKWIIDGNYTRSMGMRLEFADTAVFLDYPTWVCLWRVIKRIFQSYGKVRPDMGDGCPERLDSEFLKYVWNFRRRKRGKIISILSSAKDVNIITIRSRSEYDKFLLTLFPLNGIITKVV